MSNFGADLKRGRLGEEMLMKLWPGLISLGGKGADLKTVDNELVELKTDFYSMKKTPNMFIEIWGNLEQARLGGVKKALQDGCKWFVYLYIKDETAFVFDCKELGALLDSNTVPGEIKYVENNSYTTMGLAIDRQYLVPISRVINART